MFPLFIKKNLEEIQEEEIQDQIAICAKREIIGETKKKVIPKVSM